MCASNPALITYSLYQTHGKELNTKIIIIDGLCDHIDWTLVKRVTSKEIIQYQNTHGELDTGVFGQCDDKEMKQKIIPIEFNNYFYGSRDIINEINPYLDQLLTWIIQGMYKHF